jgi:hypothetical protein
MSSLGRGSPTVAHLDEVDDLATQPGALWRPGNEAAVPPIGNVPGADGVGLAGCCQRCRG